MSRACRQPCGAPTGAMFSTVTYGRSATLWKGRYRVIDSEPYLFARMRYVEENPVRAGMVVNPGAYRWSDDPANALGEARFRLRLAATVFALRSPGSKRWQAPASLPALVLRWNETSRSQGDPRSPAPGLGAGRRLISRGDRVPERAPCCAFTQGATEEKQGMKIINRA